MRASLAGDRGYRESSMSVPVALDDDCGVTVECGVVSSTVVDSTLPMLALRVRSHDGYDSDGNPVFTWNDLVTARSVVWEQRTEVDDVSGLTLVVARTIVPLAGSDDVRETLVVWDEAGARWRCSAVDRYPERLELLLERVDE